MLKETTMNTDFTAAARVLANGRIDRVGDPLGRRVECLTGCLWITQDGDLRDLVVQAGEGVLLDRPGAALISALADSQYLLLVPTAG
jgi:hypothetical protein